MTGYESVETSCFSESTTLDARGLDDLNAAIEPKGRLDAALCQLGDLRTTVRWGAVALLLAVFAAVVLATDRRPDLSVYPSDRMARDLGSLLVATALLAFVSLRPLCEPPLSKLWHLAAVAGAVAAAVALASSPLAHADHQASLGGVGEALLPRALGCFMIGGAFATTAALVLAALNRGARGAWPPGPVASVLAATIGLIALHLRCPLPEPLHLWLGHVTVLAPFIVLAYVLRDRLEC